MRFELSLVLEEDGDDLAGEMEFDTRVYAEETIALMARHLSLLLDQMVADPDGSVADVSLVDPQEIDILSAAFSGALED